MIVYQLSYFFFFPLLEAVMFRLWVQVAGRENSFPACFLKKKTKNLWNMFRRFQSLLVFAKN